MYVYRCNLEYHIIPDNHVEAELLDGLLAALPTSRVLNPADPADYDLILKGGFRVYDAAVDKKVGGKLEDGQLVDDLEMRHQDVSDDLG